MKIVFVCVHKCMSAMHHYRYFIFLDFVFDGNVYIDITVFSLTYWKKWKEGKTLHALCSKCRFSVLFLLWQCVTTCTQVPVHSISVIDLVLFFFLLSSLFMYNCVILFPYFSIKANLRVLLAISSFWYNISGLIVCIDWLNI